MSTEREIIEALHAYIARKLLDGDARGLDAETPLLGVGILDSMALLDLIEHVETEYGVEVSPADVRAECFRDLRAVAALVGRLMGGARPPTADEP